MGTRSRIGIVNTNGSILSIYCHWDGYLSHNGKILNEHYTDEAKIRKLMKLGDLSSLGAEIGVKHPFDPPMFGTTAFEEHEKKYNNMCPAYGRDRGEKDVNAKTSSSIKDWEKLGEEFNYLFAEGQWTVSFWDRPRMLLERGCRRACL